VSGGAHAPKPERRGRPWLAVLPFVIFIALSALFLVRLGHDASQVPSVLIGKPAPQFSLPPLAGVDLPGFDDGELRRGKVTLVNVFASWCGPCRDEHPQLMRIAEDKEMRAAGVRVFGLNYKDRPSQAVAFLNQLGNPYTNIGVDPAGRSAIDWGVYGVPETFVVRGDGVIAYKFIGPISAEALEKRLLPAIREAMQIPSG